ncbi:unnamed protein product, partial [Closterium sp. NIES-54]
VAALSQVLAAASGSGPVSAPCSCRLLSHQTLLWHHRLGHPSLPRLRGMASRVLPIVTITFAGTGAAGATGVGAARGVGAGETADAGPSEGAGAGTVGAGTVGAGGAAGAGAAAERTGAVPTGSGGATRPRPYFVPLLEQVLGLPLSSGPAPPLECPQPVQSQSALQPVSTLPAPSPYTGPSGGLAELRVPASRPGSHARPACTSRQFLALFHAGAGASWRSWSSLSWSCESPSWSRSSWRSRLSCSEPSQPACNTSNDAAPPTSWSSCQLTALSSSRSATQLHLRPPCSSSNAISPSCAW